MPINLTSNTAKRREQRAQVQHMMMIERAMTKSLAREFKRVGRAAAKTFKSNGSADIDIKHIVTVTRVLNFYKNTAAGLFAKRVVQAAPGKCFSHVREVKATEQQLIGTIANMTSETLGAKVKSITSTTRDRIAEAVNRGHSENLTTSEVADLIEESTGGLIADNRADTIARTEVHSSSQLGNLAAADSLGVAFKKEWISAEDDRTRPSHSDADGQVVDRDESFSVGDSSLEYPGDPAGPPEEVINCRCVVTFQEVEDSGA